MVQGLKNPGKTNRIEDSDAEMCRMNHLENKERKQDEVYC